MYIPRIQTTALARSAAAGVAATSHEQPQTTHNRKIYAVSVSQAGQRADSQGTHEHNAKRDRCEGVHCGPDEAGERARIGEVRVRRDRIRPERDESVVLDEHVADAVLADPSSAQEDGETRAATHCGETHE
jgi:hypothetical protein